jgi:indole-3-glycerol phosphate synthase
MSDVLAQIVADKRLEVARARQRIPLEELQTQVANAPKPRNFFSAITRPKQTLRVIAEVKRASPSAGTIRQDFNPADLARAYYDNGAAAISCLTDQKYFAGSLDHLQQVRQAVPLPILRKDFIVDPYQIYEAALAGADAVLLIADCLDEAELLDLLILATKLQLTTLVEVHEVDSLLKVRPHLGFPHPAYTLLGINNRNLKTMETDLRHTLRMAEMIEDLDIVVSESGIKTPDDIKRLMDAGIYHILVGEHLMKQPDVGAALRELIGPYTS